MTAHRINVPIASYDAWTSAVRVVSGQFAAKKLKDNSSKINLIDASPDFETITLWGTWGSLQSAEEHAQCLDYYVMIPFPHEGSIYYSVWIKEHTGEQQ